MLALFWASIVALVYVYLGYPLLLRLLVAWRGCRPTARRDITPSVTLVISAYNEAPVIRRKLENALALDYPRERLMVAVISDASDDDTDDIVRDFASQGIRLFRQAQRRGKTAGLNRVVPELQSEIVVFSDANALYQPDAVRMLVRNFADPHVGCVTGEARYLPAGGGAADAGERMYWDYEAQSKRLETCMGSMVGGDGAIYAIRRGLWQTLPDTAINDFLNPLQIVAAGYRAVYEPDAICYEETAGDARKEFRRRVRIVSRSWRAVFQAPQVLNPFRCGFFSVAVVSHKVLRWWSGAFVIAALIAAVDALWPIAARHPTAVAALAAAMGLALMYRPVGKRTGIALYFLSIQTASLTGVFYGSIGRVPATWTPPRSVQAARTGSAGYLLLLVTMLVVGAAIGWFSAAHSEAVALVLFWVPLLLITYVCVGYPAVLALLARLAPRRVRTGPVEPHVCLFIAANDEEAVIAAKLRNSLELDYPRDRLSILVASDGSIDRTTEIVRSFGPAVRLVDLSRRRGKIGAINAGVHQVPNEAGIIVFTDANAFLDRGALRALVSNFSDERVGAVSGDVVLVGDRAALAVSEDLYYHYERWLQHGESIIGSMVGVDGALYAIRRHLFVPAPPDTILDDVTIPMAIVRQGYRVVFESAARATEQGSLTAVEEFLR